MGSSSLMYQYWQGLGLNPKPSIEPILICQHWGPSAAKYQQVPLTTPKEQNAWLRVILSCTFAPVVDGHYEHRQAWTDASRLIC